jgi:hypothetical protein
VQHGHSKAEERHRALHRLAFEKLRADPEGGKEKMRRLLDRWLAESADNRSAALWRRWSG